MILTYGTVSNGSIPMCMDCSELLNIETVKKKTEEVILNTPEYPGHYEGRGIVICGGGAKYFPGTYVLISILRQFGCELPIQVWHIGPKELDDNMKALLTSFNVECIDAQELNKTIPFRILEGWPLKAYAIFHSPFKEVLLLDADNVPVVDPTWLFEWVQFKQRGAVFWPDIERLSSDAPSYVPIIWDMLGIPVPEGKPEFESAQVLINKEKCWRALYLCKWMNEHSDFFYRFVYGDKETFNLAWRKTKTPFAMPNRPIHFIPYTLCQHDFLGNRIFQHRNAAKWRIGQNKIIPGFWYESDCINFLQKLGSKWRGVIGDIPKWDVMQISSPKVKEAVSDLIKNLHLYKIDKLGDRVICFSADGSVGRGEGLFERVWDIREEENNLYLYISSETERTCRLKLEGNIWKGNWLIQDHPSVEISAIRKIAK